MSPAKIIGPPGQERGSIAPWVKDDVVFYKHQIEGIRALAKWRSFILADDMGLGKSLEALTMFAINVYRGRASKAIVVAPVTLLTNWANEIKKFTGFQYMVLGREPNPRRPGRWRKVSPEKRVEQLIMFELMQGPKILILNYDLLPGPNGYIDLLVKLKFDTAILDEAHYVKGHDSQRTEAVHKLSYSVKSTMLLTGSPLLNHVDDLWSLLHMIDPNTWKNYWSFRSRYCAFGGYKGKAVTGVKNEKELRAYLNQVMLRRMKTEVFSQVLVPDPDTGEMVNLYEPKHVQRLVTLSEEQQRLYDKIDEEMLLENEAGEDEAIEWDIAKYMRLLQVCGTTATLLGPDKDESSKLDLVVEDALDLLDRGEKVVFFTQLRPVLEMFLRRMDKASPKTPLWELHGDVPVVDRQSLVDEWEAESTPGIMACMLQVAGVGLNMTAAKYCQFADKLYVPRLNGQAVDRLNRIGQTGVVTVLEYLAVGTREQRVEKINKDKIKVEKDILEDTSWTQSVLKAMRDDDEEDEAA